MVVSKRTHRTNAKSVVNGTSLPARLINRPGAKNSTLAADARTSERSQRVPERVGVGEKSP